MNPTKQTERQEKIQEAKKDYADNFGDVDLQKAYDSLFEILWYSQLPCYDVKDVTSNAKDQMSIIKRCQWKGREISCPAIFKTLPTDRGMCCSFNMEMAEEIFQKSRYADVVQARQMSDTKNRFVFYSKVWNKHTPTLINFLIVFQGLRPYSGLHRANLSIM